MARMRSPNYPACGLDDAVAMARSLWDKEKRTAVPANVAATAIGYKSLSGPARVNLAAMKKYGLLEDSRDGMRVSDLALRILHPANDGEKLAALQEAALKPELFKQMWESQPDASDTALKSQLINKLGFSEVGAKGFVDSFRDTMGFANLGKWGYSGESESKESEARPVSMSSQSAPITQATTQRSGMLSFSWLLAKDLMVELKFSGKEVRPEHIDRLAKYLDLAKDALEEEATEKTDS